MVQVLEKATKHYKRDPTEPISQIKHHHREEKRNNNNNKIMRKQKFNRNDKNCISILHNIETRQPTNGTTTTFIIYNIFALCNYVSFSSSFFLFCCRLVHSCRHCLRMKSHIIGVQSFQYRTILNLQDII